MGKEKKEKTTDKKIIASESSIIRITILVSLLICTAALGGYLAGSSKTIDKIVFNHETGEKNKNFFKSSEQPSNEIGETNQNAINPLDLTKSLNTTGKAYSNAKETQEDIGLTIKVSGNSAVLITDPKFCNLAAIVCGPEPYETEIRNFNGKIASGFVGEVGQSIQGTRLFYLMEDGTVEYTRVFAKAEDSNGNFYYVMNYAQETENGQVTSTYFSSQGKVPGVKDVYKIYLADVSVENGGGYRTTIAATKDGSFYDLGEIVK